MKVKSKALDHKEIKRILQRMVHEILEKNHDTDNLAIIGIRTRGVVLAKYIAEMINKIEDKEVFFGILDITLYRDDLSEIDEQPLVRSTEIPFDLNKKRIIFIEDVLFTGRTVRAGLDALIDLGRPDSIQLGVLIDRGHRQLPIQADFIGKTIPTARKETVKVNLQEIDGTEEVLILE